MIKPIVSNQFFTNFIQTLHKNQFFVTFYILLHFLSTFLDSFVTLTLAYFERSSYMKNRNTIFTYPYLLTGISLCTALLLLFILFLMGHDSSKEVISCTGIIEDATPSQLTVQFQTGPYKGQHSVVTLPNPRNDLRAGMTVALQLSEEADKRHIHLVSGYAEYERAKVLDILSDNTLQDPIAENAYRGEQKLIVEIHSGQYKGMTLEASNVIGPMYNQPMKKGDAVVVLLSTDADGTLRGSIYEYDRTLGVGIILGLFILSIIMIGGRTGLRSLLGLLITLLALLFILIPLLLKGYPTLIITFILCADLTFLCLLLLGGLQKKTFCAILGTLSGMICAILFAYLAGKLLRISGLRMEYAESLLQLRQTGMSSIGISNILTAGVMISALGAVMDVAMSLSSATYELYKANPTLSTRQLWHATMRIARDMVGTMTNTLVLALFGSSLMLIIYLHSLDLSLTQLISSSYLSLELISSIASSIGIILSVPFTAAVSVFVLKKEKQRS